MLSAISEDMPGLSLSLSNFGSAFTTQFGSPTSTNTVGVMSVGLSKAGSSFITFSNSYSIAFYLFSKS